MRAIVSHTATLPQAPKKPRRCAARGLQHEEWDLTPIVVKKLEESFRLRLL